MEMRDYERLLAKVTSVTKKEVSKKARRPKPRPKSEVVTHKSGYKYIYVDGKLVLEHRHLMEQKIGRSLAPGEIVIHLNGDKGDNRLGNLMLGFKAGINLHELTCPHCEKPYLPAIANAAD
jgi:hypothetical protein